MFYHEWKFSINPKKFEDINLAQFKNTRIKTLLSYLFRVWFFLILKLAFLVSDCYTCIKLLAYNSWSNNVIKPYLPFNISKWLFSGCIFVSFALILWEIILGIRVLRTRNIALCYVNKFARLFQSITDYSKFCIMDMITPSNSFEKWTFFIFFELKDCIGLLFADTPRQVINALTLWSVVITTNRNNLDLGDLETFSDVLSRIRYIAKYNHAEAVLLSFMLFSFAIWLFFITKLTIAIMCSPFVYYKLIKRGNYTSIREFCCISISNNIDSILAKQKEELDRYDSASILRLNIYDDESRLETETIEISEFDKYDIEKVISDSSSESLPNAIPFKLYHTNESETLVLDEPKQFTSIIYGSNPKIHQFLPATTQFNSSRTRPKPNISLDTNGIDQNLYNDNHVFIPDKAYFRTNGI
ncbi:similar to Saccharomyces cerevisiae YML047C PRM6 Pheromone-regulated protein, predicted to have 2 transmembrane segments [Maudiozyma saulgeensis]|uniref:Similar to Saccharomyces cerevisiae YML047C PRM6 Pheromone-regulated protein, predicted to have 2 transmembrane segments n=1 Tax=Maudiozyma saulgeensis TaxID=1789683 RepID=A0A1X7R141_9SACH|nr:similar to Saccharomyces cerevisiae YML047C PRM6 Pheromone-regulated protein, predicted to have 2 transmembrane segments [Kazachstania saulgeensis]